MTDSANLFQAASTLALPGWLWLLAWLFLPAGLKLKTRFIGLVVPGLLAILYGATALVYLAQAQGGYASLEGVLSLFGNRGATLAGWVHFLSFDLIVGWFITQHAYKVGVNRLIVALCLFITFILGPLGLMLYAAIYCSWKIVQTAQPSKETDSIWRQILFGQSTLAQCGVFLLMLLPLLCLAMLIDTRTVLDVNVWVKPVKFVLSLSVYTLTLSWFSNYVNDQWRASTWYQGYARIVVIAIVLEMTWLIYAAAIAEPSHFNQTHPVLAPVYFVMGVLAIVLTAQSLVTGIGVLKNRDTNISTFMQNAIGLSLVLTFVLTVAVASYMSSSSAQSHAVLPTGVSDYSLANSLPLVGWLREVGDLRVAHFFATHTLHFIPLIALLMVRIRLPVTQSGARTTARNVVLIIAAGYSALVILLFIQALAGKPFM